MDIVNDLTAAHLEYWSDYEAKVCNFTTPDERAVGIKPAVAVVTEPRGPDDMGVQCVHVVWRPSEIDLAHLARGGTIWLTTVGGLPPHRLEVQAP